MIRFRYANWHAHQFRHACKSIHLENHKDNKYGKRAKLNIQDEFHKGERGCKMIVNGYIYTEQNGNE
jgi:hypothetical protein